MCDFTAIDRKATHGMLVLVRVFVSSSVTVAIVGNATCVCELCCCLCEHIVYGFGKISRVVFADDCVLAADRWMLVRMIAEQVNLLKHEFASRSDHPGLEQTCSGMWAELGQEPIHASMYLCGLDLELVHPCLDRRFCPVSVATG